MMNWRILFVIFSVVLTVSAAITTPAQKPPVPTYTIPSNIQRSFNNSAKVTPIVNQPNGHPKPDLEWTALGDSYAAGVGTGNFTDGLSCLRYDESYPVLMNLNPAWPPDEGQIFPPGLHQLNYLACAGATIKDVLKWQLLDKGTFWEPTIAFGRRPAFGSPEFATLTAGGDDIDFPGIVFNCILGIHIPGGPEWTSCNNQRNKTWSLLGEGDYFDNMGILISEIMQKGRQGPKGNDFRLYVTGYARFFNDETTGSDTNCDSTTFQIDGPISGRPLGPDGAKDAMMTQELRLDFNRMADFLNAGIENAVATYNDPHVKFIDIQTDAAGNDILKGHRFCEKGVQEPDADNPNLWIWHYPYAGSAGCDDPGRFNETHVAMGKCFEEAYTKTWNEAGSSVHTKYPTFREFLNAVINNITPEMFKKHGIEDWNDPHAWGGFLGCLVRTFHPQFSWHNRIRAAVLAQYALDHKPHQPSVIPPTATKGTTTALPTTIILTSKGPTSTRSTKSSYTSAINVVYVRSDEVNTGSKVTSKDAFMLWTFDGPIPSDPNYCNTGRLIYQNGTDQDSTTSWPDLQGEPEAIPYPGRKLVLPGKGLGGGKLPGGQTNCQYLYNSNQDNGGVFQCEAGLKAKVTCSKVDEPFLAMKTTSCSQGKQTFLPVATCQWTGTSATSSPTP